MTDQVSQPEEEPVVDDSDRIETRILPKVSENILENARQALAKLTPEEYARQLQDLKVLNDAVGSLPEAGASFSVKLYGKDGAEVMVTMRGWSGPDTWDRMKVTLLYVMQDQSGLDWKPRREPLPQAPVADPGWQQAAMDMAGTTPSTTEAQYIPVDQAVSGTNTNERRQKFIVRQVAHKTSQNGHPYVNVISDPPWHKWGFNAWPESLPPDVVKVFEQQWPENKPQSPPPSMAYVTVKFYTATDGKEKTKVERFDPA